LHRAGTPFRKVETNSKLVLSVKHNLNEMRAGLIREGVPAGDIKAYPGLTGPLCDRIDPEGSADEKLGIKPFLHGAAERDDIILGVDIDVRPANDAAVGNILGETDVVGESDR
jgi:hypothetical protein